MINDFPHSNLYTRIRASAHGVGVFAIRDIPAGTALFRGDVGVIVRVPRTTVEKIADPEVRRMYFDFCPTVDDAFIAPADFNQLTMSWHMNHCAEPNVDADEEIRFVASRYIAVGEELTIDYTKFSGHAADAIATWRT